MADIAKLGFSANTGDLDKARVKLDALVPAAKGAEKATDAFNRAAAGITTGSRGAAAGIQSFAGAVNQAAAGANSVSRSALMAGTAMGTVQRAAMGASEQIKVFGLTAQQYGPPTAAYDAYREALKRIENQAPKTKTQLDRLGQSANDNINKLQSTPGNIAAQFQDIGVTAAGGMNPLLIALQQGTQLSAAFQGGLSNLKAGLAQVFNITALGTIAVVAFVAIIIQMAIEFGKTAFSANNLSAKLEAVKISSYGLQDAQTILGGVMDITTGKINTQSGALLGLAKAQLALARVKSQAAAAEAESKIRKSAYGIDREGERDAYGNTVGRLTRGETDIGRIADGVRKGTIGTEQAIDRLDKLNKAGKITTETFADLASTYANLGVERANQKVFADAERLLKGDNRGNNYLLKPKDTASNFIADGRRRLAIEQARAKTVGMSAAAAGEYEERTRLLADAEAKGIPITADLRSEIDRLAAGYGKAKGVVADYKDGVRDANKAQRQAESEARKAQRLTAAEAKRYADILEGGQNDISKQIARASATELTAEAAATLEQKTALLNKANSAGLKIDAARAKQIDELAASYGRAKIAADNAVGLRKIFDGSDASIAGIKFQADMIGLYGRNLAYATEYARLLAEAQKTLTPEAVTAALPELRNRAGQFADASAGRDSKQFMEDQRRAADERSRSLEQERAEIGMSATQLTAYRLEQDMLREARQRNIELSPTEITDLRQYAQEHAMAEAATRRTREALDFTREGVKSFVSDMRSGLEQGKNFFSTFADSVLKSLDRVLDKLIDVALNSALGGGGDGVSGFLKGFGGNKNPLSGKNFPGAASPTIGPYAVGGGIGGFAKGGTFTNGIVNSPTLFKFAKGVGMMGEAGPEAIMPLKRGRDGSLGVQMNGGGRAAASAPVVNINNRYVISGSSTADMQATVRQSAEQTRDQLRREVPSILAEYQTNGTVN